MNGTVGGTSVAGTVTASGLYTAPAVPTPSAVTLTATSQADPTSSGSAKVTIGPYNLSNQYSFTGLDDGAAPTTALVQGSNGHFYGTAALGGTNGNGTVFRLDSSGSIATLHAFSSSDGSFPYTSFFEGSNGFFYGITQWGGANNQGTIFKIGSSGNLTTVYSFTGGSDGGQPTGLIEAEDGYLYGTTWAGGISNRGTVFRLDLSGNLQTLYSFSGGADGAGPDAPLVQATGGYFYGTTENGGDLLCQIWPGAGCGTIFRIDSTGTLVTLHSFSGGSDGANPALGALIQAGDGSFYGTTWFGGNPSCVVSTNGYTGCGTIFKMDSAGQVTTLHQFSGGVEGGVPVAALLQGSDGDFYGVTTAGGDSSCRVVSSSTNYSAYIGCGTVFKMDTAGNVNALYSFSGSPTDASNPFAALISGTDGYFYGTTRWGGTNTSCSYTNNGGCGTIFRLWGPGGPLRPAPSSRKSKKPVQAPVLSPTNVNPRLAPADNSTGPSKNRLNPAGRD